jgi:uncharacterized protein YndB with AHSA1/START domain
MEVQKTISIKAPADKVWKALITPALIKQYLFGTETISDFEPGSDITYRGEWQGKPYEDKGKIIAAEPGKLLHHTYWSPNGGKEDKPENYVNVKYLLRENDGYTDVTLTQDGVKDENARKHLEENWSMVIEGLKKVVESN